MKRHKHGLILGKFMPLHSGHIYLIEEGLKRAENVTILVCSLQREVIPGYLRYIWMKERFPNANVVHISDDLPASPEVCDEGVEAFWKIWTKIILDNTPKDLDVVFTSEDYGNDISTRMNIQHECIDKQRITFPISGTQIRDNPLDYWHMIPEETRHFFVKKVVLVGPESVGKTTLAEKLAKYYNTTWVPEYGREYTENVKKTLDLNSKDFSHIAGGQLELEDEMSKKADRILICDTDLIITQIFAEMCLGSCPPWIIRETWHHKYDLHILLDIDVPFVNDGTRVFPHVRRHHFDRIKRELDDRKLKYVIINGDWNERFEKSIAEINKIL